MHPPIQAIFDDAENRYLKSEELTVLNQYVQSLPSRLEMYRLVRDQEIEWVQQVADQLQAEMPQEPVENLERSLRNALLVLRCCTMGMLLNDESFVEKRLFSWFSATNSVYNTRSIDVALYRLLNQTLSQVLAPNQLDLLSPLLNQAQALLLQEETLPVSVLSY
ncbi:hypothetical protein H6F43_15690 [Leptolyngbya sp. FACHB-36]|uniref:hypothetical protein n=1 Tax=Leptolyngbya sp. FACHB-36 TaxID=2692808 RepID=UPI0016816406|nr:hypothetical protein [Leptolyngbya sp. FACHB-36]MBD2021622.1 hypothetical protein [Leptolyngbya sp. FACHB-36]